MEDYTRRPGLQFQPEVEVGKEKRETKDPLGSQSTALLKLLAIPSERAPQVRRVCTNPTFLNGRFSPIQGPTDTISVTKV